MFDIVTQEWLLLINNIVVEVVLCAVWQKVVSIWIRRNAKRARCRLHHFIVGERANSPAENEDDGKGRY